MIERENNQKKKRIDKKMKTTKKKKKSRREKREKQERERLLPDLAATWLGKGDKASHPPVARWLSQRINITTINGF